ncbi:MAG: hypothetical protein ABIB79_04200 [archaeon]
MEKEKIIKKVKTTHPRKYPRETVELVLTLIRQQKSLKEILAQVPCCRSCVRRIARKNSLVIKKEKELIKK